MDKKRHLEQEIAELTDNFNVVDEEFQTKNAENKRMRDRSEECTNEKVFLGITLNRPRWKKKRRRSTT
jgi:hypothetical protein